MLKAQKILGLLLIVFCMVLITTSTYPAERIVFEKGDAIYREADLPTFFKDFGHCGLYWEWVDLNEEKKPNNPDDFTTHNVIESNGRWWAIFGFYTSPGVRKIIFDGDENNKDFCCTPFWGVYTASIDAAQRRLIVETAKNQINKTKYHFFWGYKNPGKSFRCDGLVEYCYEIAFGEPWEPGNNGGLIPDDTWLTLKPKDQKKSDRLKERPKAEIKKEGTGEVKEVRLEPSEDGTLKAYASDGDKGSGITMVEFWNGEPDDTPDEAPGVRLGWDDHDADVDDYYTISYDGSVAQLYAKAFDQAGNTKITGPLEDTYVETENPDRNLGSEPYLNLSIFPWGEVYQVQRIWIKTPGRGNKTLYLYCYSRWDGGGLVRDIGVYRVDPTFWKDMEITWNNQPPMGELVYTFPSDYFFKGTWVAIPIGTAGSVCIRFIDETRPAEDQWINPRFCSAEYADPDKRPYYKIK